MRVILPVCPRDLSLAILNLRLAARLDASCSFPAIISAPLGFDLSELEALASKWFSSVSVFRYHDWTGDPNWPRPQNWAWQAAARHVASLTPALPWFWWEADATPLKSGWLEALLTAYRLGGKPFAGQFIGVGPSGMRQTSGVAIYPPDVRPYCPDAFLTRATPFDCILFIRLGEHHFHPLSDLTAHYLKPKGRGSLHISTPEEAAALVSTGLVLQHGSSDGSLVNHLLDSTEPEEKRGSWWKWFTRRDRIETSSSAPLAVVITNYQRPDHLWSAFQSCLQARVPQLVISSSGATDAVRAMHQRILSRRPSTIITSLSEDRGCNEMWLRGVQAARAPYVHLLHDDDLLLPSFSSLPSLVEREPAPFYCWQAAKHGSGASGSIDYFPSLADGLYSTDAFWPLVLCPGGLSISPVAGLFPRSHLLSVLEECEHAFTAPRHLLRPSMMVGNDLMLWLRAAEDFPRFRYIRTPLISFGHWEGSATFHDVMRRENKLPALYDAARDYYLHGPEPSTPPRVLIHARTAYGAHLPAVQFAQRLWDAEYARGPWQQCLIPDDILPRLFTDNKRRVPYLKDMLALPLRNAPDDAIVVFVNSDIMPAPSITRLLRQAFQTHEAAFSFRRDVSDLRELTASQIRTETRTYCGLDLFAFTPRWWRVHSPELPDVLFATELWDYDLRLLMEAHGGKRFQYLIYHQAHEPEGSRNRNSPSQLYNRRVSESFLRSHDGLVYWLPGAEKETHTLNPR